jgi:hypothetical protein
LSSALSGEQRTLLEKLVQNGRAWLEDDLATILTGRYGIDPDGRIEAESQLTLTNAEAMVRADLVEIIDHLRSDGEDQAGSVERLVREAAFTHLNRLVAVRVAEAIGVLPQTIAEGTASGGFRDFSEIAPTIATTEWGRFAAFVRLCADELAADVPALFDPRNPLLELEPSENALERVVHAIAALETVVWAAPDTLGWVYQFFNTGEERKQMRDASAAPRNARELSVRNQFFTPSYVVDFLVHNGLGAYLAAGFPALADELHMLVQAPTEEREVDLDDVSVLDPACGSGHFLLGAYDVLEKAWKHAGVDEAAAAPAIVSSLWGVDIDPRVTQIAQAAVIFRARRHCRHGKLPMPNILCARALPAGREVDELVAALPALIGRAVVALTDELVDAPVLGPLLKVEQRLSREARDAFGTGVVDGTLSESVAGDVTEAAILDALSAIADATTSSPAQRLFAAEAGDAVRFVEAMSRRYTAVLMNPPFGDPVTSTRERLKILYPANSTRTADLFASFVDRGRSLTAPGGSIGAITTRAGLFLQSYERWRTEVFLPNSSVVLADLGYGVMEQAMVEACAYVLRDPGTSGGTLTAISVLDATDRPGSLTRTISDDRAGVQASNLFGLQISRIQAIPGSRVAYWAGDVLGAVFQRLQPLESRGVVVRRGLQTGDDFRFLRLDWEVASDEASRRRWRPFAKGGPYRPYLPECHMVADWKSDGDQIKAYPGSVVPSPQLYFEPGATWTRRTNSDFAPRLLPGGMIFGDKGPGVMGGQPDWHVAYLNSRIARACVETMVATGETTTSGSQSRSYDTGLVGLLPIPAFESALNAPLRVLWESLVALARRSAWRDEPLRSFAFDPSALVGVDASSITSVVASLEADDMLAAAAVIEAVDELGTMIVDVVSRQAEVDCDELGKVLDEAVGRSLSRHTAPVDTEAIARYWVMDIEKLIDELISQYGGSRNVAHLSFHAHRRLEVISHGLASSPRAIQEAVASSGATSPEFRAALSERLLSWLVGLSFGLVDRRVDLADLFELPELRDRSIDAPDFLVDQVGHPLDLTDRFLRVVEQTDLAGAVEYALRTVARGRSARAFITRDFFKQHLAMYSMSRRRAPVYWHLYVPSKAWGVWLYYPRLSREMLFAVVRETEQRQRLAQKQIAHLQREAEPGGGGRNASELSVELDAERRLAVELEAFRAEADRIANLGWIPDLDDGAVLNAALLADLFPAWKDAAVCRKELRAGKHSWAGVARFADRL